MQESKQELTKVVNHANILSRRFNNEIFSTVFNILSRRFNNEIFSMVILSRMVKNLPSISSLLK